MKYIITSILALAISLFADVLPNWDLTTGDSSPWSHATRLTATPTSDGLLLELVAWDSNLEASGLNLDPAECGGLSFEYRAEGFSEPTSGQIFFQTEASPGYDEQKEIFLPRLNCDGEWHSIAVDAGQVRGGKGLWTDGGRITGLRLDFADQFPGRILLRSIQMLPYKHSRAAKHGLPEHRKVELPPTDAQAWMHVRTVDREAPVFSSPMTAPANGGFDHIGHCFLRKEFEVSGTAQQALLQTVCDDEISAVYLNGHLVEFPWSLNWKHSDCVEIPVELFVQGKNLLAVDYVNTGSVGGLMLDLQVVLQDQSFVLVNLDGAHGTLNPEEHWEDPATEVAWTLAETRPGAPNPPWRDFPSYRSIRPEMEQMTVTVLHQEGSSVDVVMHGEPALTEESRVFAKLYSGKDRHIPLKIFTGSVRELGGVLQEDGAWRFHFDDQGYLRYGAPVEGTWEFGMHGRNASGDTEVSFQLGDRPMPGEKAVLRLAETPAGPVAMLNGKPFYFNVLTVDTFQAPTGMEGAGSPFNVVVSRAGGQNPEWWIGPGEYDFTALDRQLNFALANYPDAMLGFYVWCEPGLWYGRMHPERMSRNEKGETTGYYVSTLSFSNPEWLADARAALAELVRHCEKYFGPRMVLYSLMGGATCEWQGWTAHSELFSDYSETEVRQFAKFAAAQGKTVTAVPTRAERVASDGGIFRNPVRDWKAILYDRFYNVAMANAIDVIADAVKTACNGDKLVGTYYGYLQEYGTLGYCVNSGGHNDLRRLLASPNIDFLLSPNSYGLRSLGSPNAEMKPFAAIREAGKLSMLEDDTRTHLTPAAGYDQTLNLEDTIMVFRRNLAQYLSHGVPLNQLPLTAGNELDHPAIRQTFLRAVAAGQFRYEHPAPLRAEIAAVVDANSIQYLAATRASIPTKETDRYTFASNGDFVDDIRHTLPVSGEMLYYQRYPLAQCGAPVDWILLDDVPRLAAQYKLVILLGAYADTPQLRQAVEALRAAGTKFIVAYGAGFIDPAEAGFSAAPMNELLGMVIHQIGAGSIAVEFPDGRTVGADYTATPRFCVEDPEATTLAHYAAAPTLAAAAQKGNAIFYGGTLLDADFVRETAREAGAHIYCETTDNLAAGNGIISIHCNQPGTKTIRFPEATDVVDLFTGEVLGRGVTEVSFPMEGFATRALITGDADELLDAFILANPQQ